MPKAEALTFYKCDYCSRNIRLSEHVDACYTRKIHLAYEMFATHFCLIYLFICLFVSVVLFTYLVIFLSLSLFLFIFPSLEIQ